MEWGREGKKGPQQTKDIPAGGVKRDSPPTSGFHGLDNCVRSSLSIWRPHEVWVALASTRRSPLHSGSWQVSPLPVEVSSFHLDARDPLPPLLPSFLPSLLGPQLKTHNGGNECRLLATRELGTCAIYSHPLLGDESFPYL